jgi:hypothetical protein
MEAIRQFVRIPASHKVLIDIPHYIESEQLAEVILIIRESKGRREKLQNLSMAMQDPMFLRDLNETNEDFKFIDGEEW